MSVKLVLTQISTTVAINRRLFRWTVHGDCVTDTYDQSGPQPQLQSPMQKVITGMDMNNTTLMMASEMQAWSARLDTDGRLAPGQPAQPHVGMEGHPPVLSHAWGLEDLLWLRTRKNTRWGSSLCLSPFVRLHTMLANVSHSA